MSKRATYIKLYYIVVRLVLKSGFYETLTMQQSLVNKDSEPRVKVTCVCLLALPPSTYHPRHLTKAIRVFPHL